MYIKRNILARLDFVYKLRGNHHIRHKMIVHNVAVQILYSRRRQFIYRFFKIENIGAHNRSRNFKILFLYFGK